VGGLNRAAVSPQKKRGEKSDWVALWLWWFTDPLISPGILGVAKRAPQLIDSTEWH